MTIDRQQFHERSEELRRQRTRRQAAQLHVAVQSAVEAEHLVGNPYWDKFLSQVQSRIDESEKQLGEYQDSLTSPTVVNADQIILLKIAVAMIQERIAALRYVIALPKTLMAAGETAIDRMDEAGL